MQFHVLEGSSSRPAGEAASGARGSQRAARLVQAHRKGDAIDPWIPVFEQGEESFKISTLYIYKDINLQVNDQDPAFLF
ncbi:hypothetical protein Tco_0437748 [Tanacetum coccineum]